MSNACSLICAINKTPLPEDDITELHFHSCMEIGICVEGSGSCYVDNRVYHYAVGDIQIVLPYQPHLSNSDKGNPARWVWISFDPYKMLIGNGFYAFDKLNHLLEKNITFTGVFSQDEYPELSYIINSLSRESTLDVDYSREYSILLVCELLIALSRIKGVSNYKKPVMKATCIKILPAFTVIKNNLGNAEALSLENLASACSMSSSSLRRLFHEFSGQSPKQFIIKARLSYAEYMLLNSHLSIIDIAAASGFDNISCFTRSFKKVYGSSPSAFRKEST